MVKILQFRESSPGPEKSVDALAVPTPAEAAREPGEDSESGKGAAAALCMIMKIRRVLDSRAGHISKSSIAVGADAVRDFSLQDLISIAEQESEDQWIKRPGYYWALSDALQIKLFCK